MSNDPMFGCWIDCPPSRLWWQCGDEGPKRLGKSPTFAAALQILAGEEPTRYQGDAAPSHGPEQFTTLVESLKDHGWRGPRVSAWINRRGEIVLTDGMHRSAAALALEMETIPVAIVARDEDWWKVKHALKKLNGGVKLYQPVDHPDLRWPAWRKDTDARARIIGGYLRDSEVQRVADIGCHSGALALALARQGLEVTGYDTNPLAVAAAQALAPCSDIGGEGRATFEVSAKVPPLGELDAVVMLSALNHRWEREDWEGARDIVAAIFAAAPLLVFDCPAPGDPVAGGGKWTDPEQVLAWMAKTAGPGDGFVLAERGAELQRTLLVYEKERDHES